MEILCMPRLVSTPLCRPPSATLLPARRNAKHTTSLSFLPIKSVALRKTESFSPRSSVCDDGSAVKVNEQPGKAEITSQTEGTEHKTPAPAVDVASTLCAEDVSAVKVDEQPGNVVVPGQSEAAGGVENDSAETHKTSVPAAEVDDSPSNSSSVVEVDEQPGKGDISPRPAVEMVSSSEQESVEWKFDIVQFLNGLNLELKQEDIYPILLYGGSAFLVIWISSAVISATDSIPLIPKFLEAVGLGYTIWFSYRNLIYKDDRDKLFARIDKLKQEILGSTED